MEFEIGKEYLYEGQIVKLVFIAYGEDSTKFLMVYKVCATYVTRWVSEEELKELPPYHDFKRGEPVMAVASSGYESRRYFSHVDDKGRPHCFENGMSAWTSEEMTSAWHSVRKLTPEEQEEYNKCL